MARDDIARILCRLEQPVTPDPEFAEGLYRRLAERMRIEDQADGARPPQPTRSGRRWLVPAAVAASLAIAAAVVVPILIDGEPSDTTVVAESTTAPPTTATTIPPGTSTTTEPPGSTVVTTVPPVDAVLAINTVQFVGTVQSGAVVPSIQETGVAGAFVRMHTDEAGLPVLAYVDWSTGTIRTARCIDPVCAEPAEIREVATLSRSIWGLELVLDTDGDPVTAYAEPVGEPGNEDHMVRLNLVTADGRQILMAETPVSGGGVDLTGLYMGADGAPVATYWRVVPHAGAELWLAACTDPACTGVEQRRVDTAGFSEWFELRAFGVDPAGRPTWVITTPDGQLTLLRCEEPLCSQTPTEFALDLEGPPRTVALGFGPDGSPVIAHQAEPEPFEGGPLEVAVCGDPDCTSVSSATVGWADEGSWAWGEGSIAGGLDVAVDDDGHPLVVWESANQIWIARCTDRNCSDMDASGTVARAERGWLSASFGVDGPLIAHFTGTDVAMLACADDVCSAPEIPDRTTLDLEGAHWLTTTLASGVDHWWDVWEAVVSLDAEGHLVVPDEIDDGIELLVCGDAACTSVDSVTIPVGMAYFTALVPPDGLPFAGADLEGNVVKCTDPECGAVEVRSVEPDGVWSDVGGDIAVGADGLPVLAYPDFTEDAAPLTVAVCDDAACAGASITGIDPTYGAFSRPRVVVDDRGRPAVAYLAWDEMRLAICGDPACTDAVVTVLDDAGSGDDGPIGLTIGTDGGPVVAFTDGARTVKVAVCVDSDCSTFSVAAIDTAFDAWVVGAGIGPDGTPIVAYVADGEAYLSVCETPDCRLFYNLWIPGIARDPYCGHADFRFVMGPGGLPYIVQVVGDGDGPADLIVSHCTDAACVERAEGGV